MTIHLKYDEYGNAIALIPQDLVESLNWNENTIIDINVETDKIVLNKKTEWSVEQLENDGSLFDLIMEDVVNNNQCHYITHNGQKFILAPYSDDMENYKRNDE